jgi:hypothetical protein
MLFYSLQSQRAIAHLNEDVIRKTKISQKNEPGHHRVGKRFTLATHGEGAK